MSDGDNALICANCGHPAGEHCRNHGLGCCPTQECPGIDLPGLPPGQRFSAVQPARPERTARPND